MNIFAVHPRPELSAKVLDNQRHNKMITESLQLLSTAVYILWPCGFDYSWSRNAYRLYNPTHVNHPCNIWLRKDYSYLAWMIEYTYYLHQEWWNRGYESHLGTYELLTLIENIFVVQVGFDPCEFEQPNYFQNSSECKGWEDVHAAYRQTLINKWRRKGYVVSDDYFKKFLDI